MFIPATQLEKFKRIYKQEFNIKLSDQEAMEKGTRLLIGIKAMYRPISKDQYQKLQERRKKLGIKTELDLKEEI